MIKVLPLRATVVTLVCSFAVLALGAFTTGCGASTPAPTNVSSVADRIDRADHGSYHR